MQNNRCEGFDCNILAFLLKSPTPSSVHAIATDGVTSFKVGDDGLLTQLAKSAVTNSGLLFSTIDSTRGFIYAPNVADQTLAIFKVDKSSGQASLVTEFATGVDGQASVLSPDGHTMYVTGDTLGLEVYSVKNSVNLELIQKINDQIAIIGLSHTGDIAIASVSSTPEIRSYRILSNGGLVPTGQSVADLSIATSINFLEGSSTFSVGYKEDRVQTYRLDETTGIMTPLDTHLNENPLIVRRWGVRHSFFVTQVEDPFVEVIDINPIDGKISVRSSQSFDPTAGIGEIGQDELGEYGAFMAKTLLELAWCKVESNGHLTVLQTFPVNPVGISVVVENELTY